MGLGRMTYHQSNYEKSGAVLKLSVNNSAK